jgi:predicted pyridoxine 5'-phosphate oxidase superfamily flavin-nucleotide-binding protein
MGAMAILTEDMKRVVREQRLGFYATVCGDGSPNLSPKGTTHVWDDDHLFFADIRSPQMVANIRRGSLVEVNVVDRSCGRATASMDRRHERLELPSTRVVRDD